MNLKLRGRTYTLKLFEKMNTMQIILVGVSVVVLIILSIKDVMPKKNTGYGEDNVTLDVGVDTVADDAYVKCLEERLKVVLESVSGVGNVDVMITLKTSAEKVALKDVPVSSDITDEQNHDGSHKRQTNSSSEESTIYEEIGKDKVPYVVKEIEPQIMGVVVVSDGGDNPEIKKEIIEAVQVLFGIESHMIKVMKQL